MANYSRLAKRISRAKIFRLTGCLCAAAIGLLTALLICFKWLNPPTTAMMLARDINYMLFAQGQPTRAKWLNLEQIPHSIQIAVIAAEDQNFASHRGVDMQATYRAFKNAWQGRKSGGGSTITQQVVKNLFLWQQRSYLRKALEIPIALLMEAIWSKRRILEVYLNIAQFSEFDYGVYWGSRSQLGKNISTISLREAAALATVLPAPARLQARSTARTQQRKSARIYRQIRQLDGYRYLARLD